MNRKLVNAIQGQDVVYFTVNIRNDPTTDNTVVEKQYNNTEPFLINPDEYYLTIPRMSIPTRTIPIFDCVPINPTSPYYLDANTLEYIITIVPVDVPNTTPVSLAIQMVSSISGGTPKDSRYYSIFEYTRFIQMVNKTLSDIWNIVVSNNTPSLLDGSLAPFFNFNAETQLIEYFADISIAEYYELYFNRQLSIFFQGYQSKYTNGSELLFQRVLNADFTLYALGGYTNFFITQIDGVFFYKFVSDYDILGNWNFAQTIQVYSNIPIQREFIDEGGLNAITKYNSLLKELFVFTEENNSLVRTKVDYQANEFDFIEMSKGFDILRDFNVSVFWTTQTGKKFPLLMRDGDSFFMKLMFIKKSYVSSYLY